MWPKRNKKAETPAPAQVTESTKGYETWLKSGGSLLQKGRKTGVWVLLVHSVVATLGSSPGPAPRSEHIGGNVVVSWLSGQIQAIASFLAQNQAYLLPSGFILQALVLFLCIGRFFDIYKCRNPEPVAAPISSNRVANFFTWFQAVWVLWILLYLSLAGYATTKTLGFYLSNGPPRFTKDMIADPYAITTAMESLEERNIPSATEPTIKSGQSSISPHPTDSQAGPKALASKGDVVADAYADKWKILEKDLAKLVSTAPVGMMSSTSVLASAREKVRQALNDPTAIAKCRAVFAPGEATAEGSTDDLDRKNIATIAQTLNSIYPGAIEFNENAFVSQVTDWFNNLGTVAIIFCFLALSRPTQELGWIHFLFVGGSVVALEFLACALIPHFYKGCSVYDVLSWSKWIGGIGAAVGYALLVGRLESRWIETPWQLVALLYGYAAIQPAYAEFGKSPIMQLFLPAFALLGKLTLLSVVAWCMEDGVLLYYFARVGDRKQGVGTDRDTYMKLRSHEADFQAGELKNPIQLLQRFQANTDEIKELKETLGDDDLLKVDYSRIISHPNELPMATLQATLLGGLNKLLASDRLANSTAVLGAISDPKRLEQIKGFKQPRPKNREILLALFHEELECASLDCPLDQQKPKE